MNSLQRSELRRLEKVIDEGKKTFIEVGSALKKIRDDKLHLDTHGSFAEYAEQRFGFKKTHAYQLIASADTAESLRNCGHFLPNLTESQAREIAKTPEEKKEQVVSRAAELAEETGKPPTAKTFKQAREEVCEDVVDEPVDAAIERARRKIPELLRSLRLQLDNLGAGDRFAKPLNAIEEFAR